MTTAATTTALSLRPFMVEELKWEAADVFTLVLNPADAESVFDFKAGQWVYLHLLNEAGESAMRAAFSIASAPYESQGRLELCLKLKGDFTKKAAQLIPTDRVALQGPFGVFTVPEGASRLVIFAAGIGITPFRSMIRDLAAKKTASDVTLFYSNKRVEGIVYFDEFTRLAEAWPAFHPIFTLTESAPPKWMGETGRMNEDMIKKYVNDFAQVDFLVCGPPEFMKSVEMIVAGQGVDMKKRWHHEKFG
ncbi:MAG: FAD-dependent oxidoreductase [bacterium]|nr:FAD-dependent oxidoreductase [bacterium]